jgi:MYXO-CTERM domain-containing protein
MRRLIRFISFALTPLAVAAALAVALTVAPAGARADDWGTPGLDAVHSRLSPEISGATFADGRWTFRPATGARAIASPVVADGIAVSVDLDGMINALGADTGALAWQASLGAGVQATPAIARGRLFVPTLGGTVVGLALADGAPLWTIALGGLNASSPTPVEGDIILGTGLPEQSVVRLDGTTGAVVWRTPAVMDQFSNTAPAVAGGLVVVGTNSGHYYAFDAATGTARWDYQADGIVNLAAPLIAGGRVYMAGGKDSDRVHAVDAATGAPSPGWPITLPVTAPDLNGRVTRRRRAVSSFAAAGGLLALETRLDDALDTDADEVADRFLSREALLGLDPATGAIVWQRDLARAVFTDPNDVPSFSLCPTPAAFAGADGTAWLAAASSLSASVTVVGAATGSRAATLTVAGRTLASPVLANGRLITVAENGAIEAQLSSVNHPPTAPILAGAPRPLDAAGVTLRWLPASDPDAELPSYELRLDSDGEVLQSAQQRIGVAAGATSASVTSGLAPGVTYTWSVRARDARGAYSPWAAPQTFTVVTAGTVSVDGAPAAGLSAALAGAPPGAVVTLGPGTFPLAQTLVVPAGVSLAGAGAGRTILDGGGLMVAVTFDATGNGHAGGLDRVTVTGAQTCVAIGAGAAGIALSHLVVRDCPPAGIAVAAGGTAAIVNATVVGNGTGVVASGSAGVKNSLITGNQIGLSSAVAGALSSAYDDSFANGADRWGLAPGAGDVALPVEFAAAGAGDFRLARQQPSTDQGDPADGVGDEPAPNGGRVNLGAFGGTADAERSAAPAIESDPPGAPRPVQTGATGIAAASDGSGTGCGVSGHAPTWSPFGLLVAALLVRRRRRRPAG